MAKSKPKSKKGMPGKMPGTMPMADMPMMPMQEIRPHPPTKRRKAKRPKAKK